MTVARKRKSDSSFELHIVNEIQNVTVPKWVKLLFFWTQKLYNHFPINFLAKYKRWVVTPELPFLKISGKFGIQTEMIV